MSDVSAPIPDDSPAGRDAARLEKVVRIGMLLDLYGGLLTERQRSFIVAHYQDDLSFGEIARGHGISRQAIHDAVKHAEAALEEYEAKLSLLARGFRGGGSEGGDGASAPAVSAPAGPAVDPAAVREAAASLRAMHETIARSGGILYNTEGVARELLRLAEALDGAAPGED